MRRDSKGLRRQEDLDGTPSLVQREHFEIAFQCGPVQEFGVNGCQLEDVLEVLIERLRALQSGPFKCRENALALTKLEEGSLWLGERTRRRTAAGVEGKNEAH